MNRLSPQTLVVPVCFALVASTHAHSSTTKPAYLQGRQQTVVVRLSDLRSAYLIRAGAVSYDASDRSPEGIRRQLQDHFEVVLAVLQVSTSTSIESALRRLEESQHVAWSSSDRANWHRYLLAARSIQLQRLRDYRDRGRFPINDRYSTEPIPIFVDRDDTACAVGHLMRLSGRESAVASIEASDIYVYVPDVEGGPIADWVLTSGLTLEEAALIQPAYGWIPRVTAPIPDDAIGITPEWSGVFRDLRFSNFQVIREADGIEMPPVNVDFANNSSSCVFGYIGCTIEAPFFNPDSPSRADLVLVESALDSPDSNDSTLPAGARPVATGSARVVIQFDVDVVSPMHRIVGRPQAAAYLTGMLPSYAPNRIALFVSGDQRQLYIDRPADGFEAVEVPGFPPGTQPPNRTWTDDPQLTQHLTVVTELLVHNGQSHQAQFMHFRVVTIPEPATWLLILISATIMAAVGRNRISSRSESK